MSYTLKDGEVALPQEMWEEYSKDMHMCGHTVAGQLKHALDSARADQDVKTEGQLIARFVVYRDLLLNKEFTDKLAEIEDAA